MIFIGLLDSYAEEKKKEERKLKCLSRIPKKMLMFAKMSLAKGG